MTRAKDELYILQPRHFFTHGQPAFGDRTVTAVRTRFIPPELLQHFEQRTWPKAEAFRTSVRLAGAHHAVAARVRDMWR